MWDLLLAILPTILRIVGYFLNKNSANNEMMKKFYEFTEAFDREYLNSVKLKKSYEEQLKKLREGV